MLRQTKNKKAATPIAGPNLCFYFIKLKQSSLVPGTLRIDPSNPSANRHLSHVHCSSAWQAPLFLGGSKPVETDVQVGMQQKSSCIKFNHSAGFVFWCSNLDWHSIVANLWSCYVLLRSVLGTSYIFCLKFSEVCDFEGWWLKCEDPWMSSICCRECVDWCHR